MRLWRAIHALPRLVRWPLKFATFLVVVGLALYPRPGGILVLLERVRDLDALIDPACPALAPLEAEVRQAVAASAGGVATLRAVEAVVYEHVPYAHDWDTWGNAEYLPTVAEVFAQGREDCDGRAIVSASLLRRLGREAHLATDLLHMWVVTPEGEAMDPTSAVKTMVSGEHGTEFRPSATALYNLFRGFSYGVAVFPVERELVIFAALVLLTIHPRQSGWQRVSGVLGLLLALVILRGSGRDLAYVESGQLLARCGLGSGLLLLGWLCLAFKTRASAASAA